MSAEYEPLLDAAAPNIVRCMAAVMGSVGAVPKGHKMEAGPAKYRYRSIEDVVPAVHAALVEHGVVVVPRVIESRFDEIDRGPNKSRMYRTLLTVEHVFYGPAGDSVAAITVGEAMDTSDKSSNKAMTAALKYALIEALMIPLESAPDPDHDRPDPGARPAPELAPDGSVGATLAKRNLVAYASTLVDGDADAAKAMARQAWETVDPAAPVVIADQEALAATVDALASAHEVGS